MFLFGLIGWGLKDRMSRDQNFLQKSSSDQNSYFLSDQKIQKALGAQMGITSGFFPLT